ncbi:MAG: prephenate dehydrogenase [Actinomycetota bacterium]|nr:MAG: prephenate dehydrogenase [Actinomycetota bacterium]
MAATPQRVLVVGTGLIGTSVALALQRVGTDVSLQDTQVDALAGAQRRTRAPAGWPAQQPDVVVVAVPPAASAGVVADVLGRYPGATVTDVTSVKAGPLRRLAELDADLSRVVGGHPLAGREVSGPAAARDDLFADRPWVLTPTPATDPHRLAAVVALVTACRAVPVTMSAADHDRAVALTSHVPQLLASVLAGRLTAAADDQVAVSGQGLRDATRVAASDPALWSEILSANAAPVAEVLDAVVADLDAVAAALRVLASTDASPAAATAAADAVQAVLRRGNDGHAKVPGKHGDAAVPLAAIPVVVADSPGELGRLFAVVGEAGVNLEDVRIEHALGRATGVVELSVRADAAAALAAVLVARGWSVRG